MSKLLLHSKVGMDSGFQEKVAYQPAAIQSVEQQILIRGKIISLSSLNKRIDNRAGESAVNSIAK